MKPSPNLVERSDPAGRAAIYARMSTDRQNYSIQLQLDAILEYAARNQLQVVRTYVDEGKSGLVMKGRVGLRSLVDDVESGLADFTTVLVYDVSRWGRFQDVDESAHYEFVCRSWGINVVYCTEQFAGDASPMSAMLKMIKRTMAAEYSRELSAKVFNAQCKLTALGFKQGGTAGYGLRRIVVGPDGKAKRVLEYQERKGVQNDRVIFALGPREEVALVRRIYRWYLDDKMGDTDITRRLNQKGVLNEFGNAWMPSQVKGILTNEKYTGCVVFNRRSFKLKTRLIHNAPENWVRLSGVFPAIVSATTHQQALKERKERLVRWTNDELLQVLRHLYRRHGAVTADLIRAEPTSPGSRLFATRFGTLVNAYTLAGIPPAKTSACARTKHRILGIRNATLLATRAAVVKAGGTVRDGPSKSQLVLNDGLKVRVVVARSRSDEDGRVRWRIPVLGKPLAEFVVAVQLNIENTEPLAYYLLPAADFVEPRVLLRLERPTHAQYRHEYLHTIFGLDE